MRAVSSAPLLVVLLAAAGSGAVVAQSDPVRDVFRDELVVTEVLLDVVVTDKKNNVIVGLEPRDFVVAEQKRIVELDSLTFYSSKLLVESAELMRGRDLAVDVVPQDRFFILFVQEQRSSGSGRRNPVVRQLEAGRQMRNWLVEEAQPADRMAIVSFGRGLRIHQDFTSDRQALLTAIDGAVRGRDPEKIPPSRRLDAALEPAALTTLPPARELRRATPNVYRALQRLAGAVKEVPGRKNLIFLGSGFGEIGTYGGYQPQLARLNPTLEALNDANVAVYTIDVTAPGVRQSLRPSLRDLAGLTGGQFFYDQASFTGILRQISDLTSGYYLLSYQSRRPVDESGYQRVRIATRNPEFRVYGRQGYFYGSPPRP